MLPGENLAEAKTVGDKGHVHRAPTKAFQQDRRGSRAKKGTGAASSSVPNFSSFRAIPRSKICGSGPSTGVTWVSSSLLKAF